MPSFIEVITFVINFSFNLVLMFICFEKYSSVINLIYTKKLVLLNWEC